MRVKLLVVADVEVADTTKEADRQHAAWHRLKELTAPIGTKNFALYRSKGDPRVPRSLDSAIAWFKWIDEAAEKVLAGRKEVPEDDPAIELSGDIIAFVSERAESQAQALYALAAATGSRILNFQQEETGYDGEVT